MNRLVFFFSISWGFVSLSLAEAAVIFSQTTPAQPTAAFSSQDVSSGPIVADNFAISLNAGATVRSIRLMGGRTNDEPAVSVDNFRVVFLQDANGIPGDLLPGGDFEIELLRTKATVGGTILNGDIEPIEYHLDLGSGILLSPDTDYWVAVLNNPTPLAGWAWARANGNYDDDIASTNSSFANRSWEAISNGGMWFELDTRNIPEPSTLAITLAGLVTMNTPRRRK